jgi:hypothetical protein
LNVMRKVYRINLRQTLLYGLKLCKRAKMECGAK